MPRRNYKQEIIDLIKKHNVRVQTPLENIKINTDIVKFKCIVNKCSYVSQNTVRLITKNGFYCKFCNKKYRREILELIHINNVQIETDLDLIKRMDDKITFICNKQHCSNKCIKGVRNIVKYGGFYCPKCTKINARQKEMKTLQQNYGVNSSSQINGRNYIKEILVKIKQFNVNVFTKLEEYKTSGDTYIEFKCLNCNKNHKKRIDTLLNRDGGFYCLECTNTNLLIKREKTCLDIYGKEHYFQTEECKNKTEATCLEKYGKEHYSQTEEWKNKTEATCLEKYGKEHYSQTEEWKKRVKATCLKKYGKEYISQVPEFFAKVIKNSFKLKNYTFKDSISVKVQGYEPFALEILEGMDFTSDDIVTGIEKIPNFEYKNNVDDRISTYFPDIYIKKIKQINRSKK